MDSRLKRATYATYPSASSRARSSGDKVAALLGGAEVRGKPDMQGAVQVGGDGW